MNVNKLKNTSIIFKDPKGSLGLLALGDLGFELWRQNVKDTSDEKK